MGWWTAEQLRALLDGVGGFGWQVLQRRTCRSKAAIEAKIFREYGGGGITRGSYSLSQVCDETGYHSSQLKRAQRALKQRWIRTARGGDFLISPEQVEEMVTWLGHDYWSIKHELYGCTRCGTDSRPHKRMGLCDRCFTWVSYRLIRLKLPASRTKLLAITLQVREDPVVLRMRTILKKGQAPSIDDLKHLARLYHEN